MTALFSLLVAATYAFYETRISSQLKEAHVSLIARTVGESILFHYENEHFQQITHSAETLKAGENILGFALCDTKNGAHFSFPEKQRLEFLCNLPEVQSSFVSGEDRTWISTQRDLTLQHSIHPLSSEQRQTPHLFLVVSEDISSLKTAWTHHFLKSWLLSFVCCIHLFLVISAQTQLWIRRKLRLIHSLLRATLRGKNLRSISHHSSDALSQEIYQLFTRFSDSKIFHSALHSFNQPSSHLDQLRTQLRSHSLVIISNREPYIHQRIENRVEMVRPASGLVSALEPILKELGGLWIAHGSGSADLEFVDRQGQLDVPPGNPRYKLRRISLTAEEQAGYYDGFSNEGLWPLCHHAFQRPRFQLKDWDTYQKVNLKFAHSLPDSLDGKPSIILIQDYHFALLPQLIREKHPSKETRIGLFWHIPWPSAEVFGICPWSRQLLAGMLGSDVIGFHTQDHCNNFLDTCNRYLEARIDWERFSVTLNNHETFIRAIPIGIEIPPVPRLTPQELQSLRARYQLHTPYVAIGIDRVDYTKGLLERIQGVERFLEKYPEYIGKFTLLQVGSPSRSHLTAYQQLSEELKARIERVNARFGSYQGEHPYQPVIFLHEHFEWDELVRFYQWGDVCLVTSLHDGMNLVAKEYVWCQDVKKGSLILSRFTGASKELSGALIVNPYCAEDLADALKKSLSFSPEERSQRMKSMKERVESQTAFHWASNLIQYLLHEPHFSQAHPQNSPLTQTPGLSPPVTHHSRPPTAR